jgi:hypothetical protein
MFRECVETGVETIEMVLTGWSWRRETDSVGSQIPDASRRSGWCISTTNRSVRRFDQFDRLPFWRPHGKRRSGPPLSRVLAIPSSSGPGSRRSGSEPQKFERPSPYYAIRSAALTTACFSGPHNGRKLADSASQNRAWPFTAVLRKGPRRAAVERNPLAMLRKRRGLTADTRRAPQLTTGESKFGQEWIWLRRAKSRSLVITRRNAEEFPRAASSPGVSGETRHTHGKPLISQHEMDSTVATLRTQY